ncbi:MAG: hypothetical protein EBQ87_16425 [Planctomycetes bacterium]|nr:hypothetical protein [Planctomycetota bacterium]
MGGVMKRSILALGVMIIFSSISLGQSQSKNNSNGTITQNGNSWNPFSFLLPNPQDAAHLQQAQLANARLAQPQNLYPRDTTLMDFFSPLPKLSNSTPIGYSNFPRRSQLPGKDYLRGFGYRYGGQ